MLPPFPSVFQAPTVQPSAGQIARQSSDYELEFMSGGWRARRPAVLGGS